MIYLETFQFPEKDEEFDFFMSVKRTCYDSYYPFGVLSEKQFRQIDFEPVTILYGGNGCGKSTALNVIADKLGAERDSVYNRSSFFEEYLARCSGRKSLEKPEEIRIITSDDVFDYMLDIRNFNEGIDRKREDIFQEYLDAKYSKFQLKSLDDYDKLKKINLARSKTQSQFVRKNLHDNVRERSNGESAFYYFTDKIRDNGLYLLDEPENSLSVERQMELRGFLENSARFFGCQFIISTHSPFLLSMSGAKIYDLDETPVDVKRWTELENVRAYYRFFKKNGHLFE